MPRRAAPGRPFASLIPSILVLTLALLAAATAARANDIPRLAGPVTDLTAARVLAPDGGRIPTRIDQLLRNDDIQLFVLFVDTTGSYTVTGFADETARLNSLGGNDVLLVVALTDRTDALWRSDYYLDRLTDAELQGVLTQQVEPHLRAGDDIGAVISCADGLAAAGRKPADVTIGPAPTAAPLPAIDGTAAALVLVGVGGSLLWGVIIARRREGDAAVALARKDAQRSQEANALLIRADEAVRDAQQELGFAEAQFEATDVTPYRDAITAAMAELRAAFTTQQQLDDAVPEDAATRGRMVEDIAARATKALALLDEQRKRVDELRETERRAPQLLAELRSAQGAAGARLPEAQRMALGLGRYAERTAAPVARNVADATALLGRCLEEITKGEAAAASGDAATGGKSARAARQDLAEATRLLDAIGALDTAVRAAEHDVPQRIDDAGADIEAAGKALAVAGTPEQRQRLAAARDSLDRARAATADARPDVFAAAKLAAEAHTATDTILAELHAEEERHGREVQLVTTQLDLARGSYERASDYIAPRRRTIGATARTRLAEAERHLERARELQQTSDLVATTTEAQRARQLADEAFSLAQDDVRESEERGPWTSGPRAADLIVPILIGAALGRHGGSRGGGMFRPSGGGHSVGGGFGGFGRPSGGGRSVGGRW